MTLARPFAASVVRPEWARRLVTGLAELPEDTGTLPPVAPPDDTAYAAAAPAFYVYRQGGHTGVVCEVDVRAFADGRVLGHEQVQPPRVDSLVKHMQTDAPPALVALLHTAGPTYDRTVDEVSASDPLLDFVGPGSLRQRVWRVPDELTAPLADELAGAVHYVADGHHRVAASLAAWGDGGSDGSSGSGVLCVVHPMDGLRLSAFHRRLRGPVDREALESVLRGGFEVEPGLALARPETGSFGLYVDGAWHRVRVLADTEALDVELLQSRVLDRMPSEVEIAPAKTEVDELTRRCDADGGVLFTLAPPPLSSLTALADAGGVMPPKTTYFEPKPCAGIFRRPADFLS